MRPSVVSDIDDADMDDELHGATSLSAAFNALTAPGARRQVRLAVPVGAGSTALGADDDRRGCRAALSERSLFIFSEENFIRKYAKIIIEWGYPLRQSVIKQKLSSSEKTVEAVLRSIEIFQIFQ